MNAFMIAGLILCSTIVVFCVALAVDLKVGGLLTRKDVAVLLAVSAASVGSLVALLACTTGDAQPIWEGSHYTVCGIASLADDADAWAGDDFVLGQSGSRYYFYAETPTGRVLRSESAEHCHVVLIKQGAPCLRYDREPWSFSELTLRVPVNTIRVEFGA